MGTLKDLKTALAAKPVTVVPKLKRKKVALPERKGKKFPEGEMVETSATVEMALEQMQAQVLYNRAVRKAVYALPKDQREKLFAGMGTRRMLPADIALAVAQSSPAEPAA